MNTKQLLNKIYKPTDWVFQKAAQTKRGTNIALISYVLLTGTLFGLAANNLDNTSKYRKVEDKEAIEVENIEGKLTYFRNISDRKLATISLEKWIAMKETADKYIKEIDSLKATTGYIATQEYIRKENIKKIPKEVGLLFLSTYIAFSLPGFRRNLNLTAKEIKKL